METLGADIKHALRMLRQSPGFTATAVAALALGIGANTAIFSVINTVLLKPLPYPQSDRIVQLQTSFPGGGNGVTSIPKYMAWRDLTEVFDQASLYDLGVGRMNMTGGDRPEQISGIHVSANYFQLFG